MKPLPLSGLRAVEFSQMILGPACGVILADLGAEVIKVEPLPKGDRTRFLGGPGAGFFLTFNRNKSGIAVDMKSPDGLQVVKDLIASADILVENFRPGLMASFGLGADDMLKLNPRLIFCSLKGFLAGPYEHRTALDEVVQMMGGLAYMTGGPDKPTRAGASVNDLMAAAFGVIAIQAALRERETTGRGQQVGAGLFENNAFLMTQHIMAEAVTGEPAIPWSIKGPPWPVYDLFMTADGVKLFIGAVGDGQWVDFCNAFERADWLIDPRLATNALRVKARPWLIPEIESVTKTRSMADLSRLCERAGLPFAPVQKPYDLVGDPHLSAEGGMVEAALPDGRTIGVPGLPLAMDGRRFASRHGPPTLGANTNSVLETLGYDADKIAALRDKGAVG